MHRFRQSNIVTVVASILAGFGWMIASNHCALGLMPTAGAGTLAAPQEHCAKHAAPAEQQPGPSPPMDCCKSLHAPPAAAAKNLVAYDSALFVVVASLVSDCLLRDTTLLRVSPAVADTGPPYACSFAESVLQRSLLSHAPPLVS